LRKKGGKEQELMKRKGNSNEKRPWEIGINIGNKSSWK
jgi:hypothetical protein